MKQSLSPTEVQWHGVKFMDRTGRVFSHEGIFYRALYPAAVAWFRELQASGLLAQIIDTGLCPNAREANIKMDGFGLIMEMETAKFSPSLPEQPLAVALDAARLWVRLQTRLLAEGYELIDAHAANFATFGGQPKWIDLGSIQPRGTTGYGYEELLQTFVRPLLVASHDPALYRIARTMFAHGGLNDSECKAIVGISATLDPALPPAQKLAVISSLLDSIELTPPTGVWGDYTNTRELDFHYTRTDATSDARFTQFDRLIERAKPLDAIDIASSAGSFTVSIARKGIPCLANDREEVALERLRRFAIKHRLPVNVQLYDALWGSPIQADLVSAMAVSHHLYLSQQAGWDVIAKRLGDRSTRVLITDFMADGLGLGSPHPNPLPDDYTIENFAAALRHHFLHVEIIDYGHVGRSRRTMIYCEGKRA